MQHARAEGTMPLSIIKDLGGVRLSYMLRNVGGRACLSFTLLG